MHTGPEIYKMTLINYSNLDDFEYFNGEVVTAVINVTHK